MWLVSFWVAIQDTHSLGVDRYLRLCTVLRPCARLVCEVYLEKSASKIMYILPFTA